MEVKSKKLIKFSTLTKTFICLLPNAPLNVLFNVSFGYIILQGWGFGITSRWSSVIDSSGTPTKTLKKGLALLKEKPIKGKLYCQYYLTCYWATGEEILNINLEYL
jgi:hypothetical protein